MSLQQYDKMTPKRKSWSRALNTLVLDQRDGSVAQHQQRLGGLALLQKSNQAEPKGSCSGSNLVATLMAEECSQPHVFAAVTQGFAFRSVVDVGRWPLSCMRPPFLRCICTEVCTHIALHQVFFQRFTATSLDDIGGTPPDWVYSLAFQRALYCTVLNWL